MKVRWSWSLSVAQTAIAVMLLDVGQKQPSLGGWGCVPLPAGAPATEICHSLNYPALLAARITGPIFRALYLSISDDYVFAAGVFLLWYLIGRRIESRSRVKAPTKGRVIFDVVLITLAFVSANSAVYSWRWVHEYSMSTALVNTAFEVSWAISMFWAAVRDLRSVRSGRIIAGTDYA